MEGKVGGGRGRWEGDMALKERTEENGEIIKIKDYRGREKTIREIKSPHITYSKVRVDISG